MRRAVGIGNLLESGFWAVAAVWLAPEWRVAAALAGACAAAQLLGGGALLIGRGDRLARLGSALTLAGGLALLALYAHAGWLVGVRFGAEAGDLGLQTLGVAAAALPWGLGFPLWQVLAGGGAARAVPGVLLAAALAWGGSAWVSRPLQTWPEQPALAAAATAAWQRWTGAPADLPAGAGPATVLLTPWTQGKPGASARGDGADLGAAIRVALLQLGPPFADAALVLDVARVALGPGAPVPVGEGGALGARGGRSPTALWRPGGIARSQVLPWTWVPTVNTQGAPAIFDSAVADATGARRLTAGWSAAPALSAESARAAALAGGRMLARHQDAQGRFAYTVAGPSGREKGGYNFPRHAGVTWFLARLAQETGDAEIAAARDLGMAYLVENTQALPDGRAFVRDPTRPDRKVWVGTTALATLAAVVAGSPAAAGWGRFVASAVDETGAVRGEMDLETDTFGPQDLNPYGQGQTLLALAALVRAGDTTSAAALHRAAAFLDDGYAVAGVGRLVVLDEHWSCLAALAAREAGAGPAGWPICRAYVHQAAAQTPTPGSGLHEPTGAAGGEAEAMAAAATLDPTGPWRASALAFGRLFLDNAYREEDAPFLERPAALQGGFRDGPGDWDVRMDSVQHIGGALLDISALLRQDKEAGDG